MHHSAISHYVMGSLSGAGKMFSNVYGLSLTWHEAFVVQKQRTLQKGAVLQQYSISSIGIV